MTYEEKLKKVLFKLSEQRKLTRKGHNTLVTLDSRSFFSIEIGDVCKILLKLQDDEKALKIVEALTPLEKLHPDLIENPLDTSDNYEGVDEITVRLDEQFDDWYDKYLLREKSRVDNIDGINLLRIYDVVLDVDQAMQLENTTNVDIDLIPNIIRYKQLFPMDSIGTRQTYCDNRLRSLRYLKNKKVLLDFEYTANSWDTVITVFVNLENFNEFYKKIQEEFKKRENLRNDNEQIQIQAEVDDAPWPDDFRWENNTYIFGLLGKLSFKSRDRKRIFKTLTDKKGNWATLKELRGNKDNIYVRSTISQIKNRLPKKVSNVIDIIPTTDDNSKDKPDSGAYRVKIIAKPKPLKA